MALYVSMTLLKFTVNSCVLNPDRIPYVPPITFLSKRPAALNTAETLWVPVLIQSRYHFLNDKRNKKLYMASGGLVINSKLFMSE